MVPQPVWQERPLAMEGQSRTLVDNETKTNPEKPAEPLPFLKNTSGRFWKQPHKATLRAQSGKTKDPNHASSAFAKREEIRKKDEAVKKLEREIKEEAAAEKERKRNITKERQQKQAEKLRLEEMAKRMGARKLQRMAKRLGRTKKVAH